MNLNSILSILVELLLQERKSMENPRFSMFSINFSDRAAFSNYSENDGPWVDLWRDGMEGQYNWQFNEKMSNVIWNAVSGAVADDETAATVAVRQQQQASHSTCIYMNMTILFPNPQIFKCISHFPLSSAWYCVFRELFMHFHCNMMEKPLQNNNNNNNNTIK